ncbi:MAG: response regulator [Anaerolineae bacterium]|nr:response regulator [Anaerolineae bacterium]
MIPPSSKGSILIIEDDLDVAEMLNAFFGVQGYHSWSVSFGEEGLRNCHLTPPDLVILDIHLPDIDGFEVAVRLRTNRRTKDIPIVFLSESKDRESRLRGLELQAEDYITKPFDMQELGIRVGNLLQHSLRRAQTNAVTGMPMGHMVDEQLLDLVERPHSAMLLVRLQNFDYFREVYGFIAHDDLLRAVAMMVKEALQEVGSTEYFAGHLKNDIFLITVEPFLLEKTRAAISRRLSHSLAYF